MPLRLNTVCKKCEHFKNSFCRLKPPNTLNFYCYESIYCHSTGEYFDVVDVKDTVLMMDNDETEETKRKRRLDDMKLNDELEVPENCPYVLEQVMEKQNA